MQLHREQRNPRAPLLVQGLTSLTWLTMDNRTDWQETLYIWSLLIIGVIVLLVGVLRQPGQPQGQAGQQAGQVNNE